MTQAMKPGDIVKRKGEEKYAIVAYSTFGISLHFWIEELQGMGKTLGDSPSAYEEDWEVVGKLPDDWEIGPYDYPTRKKNS